MKNRLNKAVWILPVSMMFAFYAVRAQQATSGHASDFTSVEYFEPPHQTMVKSRLSGAEAQPQAGGLLEIRQLKLETFDTNGVPGLIVKAPECVYDTLRGMASSAGHLRLETADGSSHVEGDGFLWRQTDSFLTISNNVQTVIEAGPKTKTGS
jgi:hypothetical protein